MVKKILMSSSTCADIDNKHPSTFYQNFGNVEVVETRAGIVTNNSGNPIFIDFIEDKWSKYSRENDSIFFFLFDTIND